MLLALLSILAQTEGAPAADSSGIHWQTLIAQVANFIILVVLLRIFLYKRVIKAMDQREEKIRAHFEAAEEKAAEAKKKAEAVDREKQEIARNREAMLQEARDEADKRRRELTDQARADADDQAKRWQDELKREKEAFLEEMQRRSGEQVCTVARRALEDLADEELERRMVNALARRLEELPDDDRNIFAAALAGAKDGLVVATAWELPEDRRQPIVDAIKKHLTDKVEPKFETARELTCGIELRAGGREISWSIQSYLEGLREALEQIIDEQLSGSQAADLGLNKEKAEDG